MPVRTSPDIYLDADDDGGTWTRLVLEDGELSLPGKAMPPIDCFQAASIEVA